MRIKKITKPNTSEDYEKLRGLWTNEFGDSPNDVDLLYNNLSATGYLLEDNGQAVSCLTTFNAGSYQGCPVQVVYAVCTDSACRGQGYASELLKCALEEIKQEGSIALTFPAEASLEQFYKKVGFEHCHYEPRNTIVADSDLDITVQAIDVETYSKYRENFLAEIPHLTASEELLKQVRGFSVNSNGLLLVNKGDAICIVDSGTKDEMYISELLVHPKLLKRSEEIADEIAAGLAKLFETKLCIYRTAGNYEEGEFYFGLPME